MAELPKFVRERLAQGPAAGEHPGAELLNAFGEDALRPPEREQLLAHLAACAQCREVVALLTPAEGPARLESKPKPRWLSFPILRFPALRWAALTAAVTVVIGAALLYRPETTQRARSDAEAPASSTAQPAASPQAAESSVGNALTASPAAKSKKVARKQIAHQPALESSAPGETTSAVSSSGSQSQAESATGSLGKTYAVNPQSVHGPHANLQQQETQSSARSAFPPEPAAAFAPKIARPGVAADTARQSRARHEMARSAMTARANPPETSQEPKIAGASSPPATSSVARAAAPPPGRAGSGAALGLGTAPGLATPYSAELAKPDAVSWSISADGQLLRKLSGEEPQTVRVADNVRFRAVASIRTEVWAGGPGGTLYHSANNGATWNRVAFPSTQDITAIAFRNARDGEITVAGGEHYVTRDGGESWQATKDF